MTSKRPPRSATWLLRHFGCNKNNDAVIGDLDERYAHGKTGVWYWRQALIAILVSFFDDIRGHKLETLRAMIVGWPIFYVLGALSFDFLARVEQKYPPGLLYAAVSQVTAIWKPATFTSLYWNTDLVIGSVMMLLIGVIPGWTIAKLHRSRKRAFLLLFSGTVLLSWIRYALVADPKDIGESAAWIAYFWMNNLLQTIGVLIPAFFVSAKENP
jgi:hypothetical protein